MISDDTFRTELDGILKKGGLKKKERNEIIGMQMLVPADRRDQILDQFDEELIYQVRKEEIPLESHEQKAFVKWWRQNKPNHPIIMIRNDGSRSPREKAEQVALGLHPGAADLYIPWLKCWVEMKRVKGSAWSEDQQEFKRYVESIGDTYLLCHGADEAIQAVSDGIRNRVLK